MQRSAASYQNRIHLAVLFVGSIVAARARACALRRPIFAFRAAFKRASRSDWADLGSICVCLPL